MIQRYDNNEDPLHANHQASLLRMREMLEAKAEEWLADVEAKAAEHQGYVTPTTRALYMKKWCADELLALAATLGNQGK